MILCPICNHEATIEVVLNVWRCRGCTLSLITDLNASLATRDPRVDPTPDDVVTACTSEGVQHRTVIASTMNMVTYSVKRARCPQKVKTVKLKTWRGWCRNKKAAATYVALGPCPSTQQEN